MSSSNNPTAMSAVVGEELEIGGRPGAPGELVKELIMPAILFAFATYLLIGILTMRVPEGTMFPGPQFFPGIIAAGLYVFALLLAVAAVRQWRAGPAAESTEVSPAELLIADEIDDEASAGAPAAEPKRVGVDWTSLAWVVGGFLAFTFALPYLGWILGAAGLFWCVARGFGARKPLFLIFVGLTVSSLTYIVFDMLLGLNLPSGLIGWGF